MYVIMYSTYVCVCLYVCVCVCALICVCINVHEYISASIFNC